MAAIRISDVIWWGMAKKGWEWSNCSKCKRVRPSSQHIVPHAALITTHCAPCRPQRTLSLTCLLWSTLVMPRPERVIKSRMV